ncbi:uncharacterized protein [Centroberyx affinis]|uniref:uncharacterized protein n=1 Tax=Centroberyx affinis TaxID=166261 RepID=UPI003A5C3A78
MEGINSNLECQICLNEYSWKRRAKRLACQHTCCSACLSRLVTVRHNDVDRGQMNRPSMDNDPQIQMTVQHVTVTGEESTERNESYGHNGMENGLGHMGRSEPEFGYHQREAPVRNNSVEVNMNNMEREETAEMTRGHIQILTNRREIDRNEVSVIQADISTNFSAPRMGQSETTEISTNQIEGRTSSRQIWVGPNCNVTNQRVILCPWCRCVTALAAGMSVNNLPDDDNMATVVPTTTAPLLIPDFTPVFIRLVPSASSHYVPPWYIDVDGCGRRDRARGAVTLPISNLRSLPLDGDSRMWEGQGEGGRMDGEMEVCVDRRREEGWDEGGREEGETRSTKMQTRVCAALVLGLGIFFLTCIVLHSLTCPSKPFTMITCG